MKIAYPPPLSSIKTEQDARKYIFSWENSYSKLPTVLSLIGKLPDDSIYKLLGEEWCGFDNVSVNLSELRPLLIRASRKQLDSMMTKEERSALGKLPEVIEIYRGCH